MKVATANVKETLDATKAGAALDAVLATKPQIVGLQEWRKGRASVLASRGQVYRLPRLRKRLGRKPATSGYVFGYPLGGGPPVGVDAAWGELLTVRTIRLAPGSKKVRPTLATEAIIREHATGLLHIVLNFHLLAHHDRAAYLAGWKIGRAKAIQWVDSWAGFTRWVFGDTNDHLMGLPPLTSCWQGNPLEPTLGRRTIDNIYGERKAASAHAFNTPSDHDAVVADYPEKG